MRECVSLDALDVMNGNQSTNAARSRDRLGLWLEMEAGRLDSRMDPPVFSSVFANDSSIVDGGHVEDRPSLCQSEKPKGEGGIRRKRDSNQR